MNAGALDLEYLSQMLKSRCGMTVSEDRRSLAESRLLPVLREHKLASFQALNDALKSGKDEVLATEVTEAMLAGETSFFRDTQPFRQLRELILPYLLGKARGIRHLRILSAGCATGQETYSIAMCMAEEARALDGMQVEIVGIDLSAGAIHKAQNGLYSQLEVQRGIPITMLIQYFEQKNDKWQVRDSLRAGVQFKQANLLGDLSGLGMFDIVFCRNALVHFDADKKSEALTQLHDRMQPHAVLCLGKGETLYGVNAPFKAVSMEERHRGLYVSQDFSGILP